MTGWKCWTSWITFCRSLGKKGNPTNLSSVSFTYPHFFNYIIKLPNSDLQELASSVHMAENVDRWPASYRCELTCIPHEPLVKPVSFLFRDLLVSHISHWSSRYRSCSMTYLYPTWATGQAGIVLVPWLTCIPHTPLVKPVSLLFHDLLVSHISHWSSRYRSCSMTNLYPTWATGQAGIVLVPSATIKVPPKKRARFVGAGGFAIRSLQQETGELLPQGQPSLTNTLTNTLTNADEH